MTPPPWRQLLEVARWTPSPHNTQPWRLRPMDAHTADLFIVKARTLPDEDTTGSFIRCAMGMFIESLTVTASHQALNLTQSPLTGDEQEGLIPFARLTLTPGAHPDHLSPADIINRRTSRLPPDPDPVPESDLASLAAIADGLGQNFSFTSDPSTIASIMHANLDALAHDLNDPRYHDEIIRWFRYGRAHAAKTNDGLDSSCMNMAAHELFVTAKLPRLLTLPPTQRLMRALYSRRLGPVRQIGFVSGPFFEPGAAQQSGRALIRLWLEMHRRNIGIHPFGNLVTNPVAHRRLSELTGRDRTWLVFRLGHTPTPPRSLRLSAESITCGDS